MRSTSDDIGNLTGAAILLSAGYILRRQRLDTLDVRAGQIRLVRAISFV